MIKRLIYKVIRFFRMRYVRLIINISKKSRSNHDSITDIQKTTMSIFNSLVRDVDADLLYAPVSDKIFIQKGNFYLSLNNASNGCILNISGEDKSAKMNYHYDIWFNDYHYKLMRNRFMKSIDKRRIVAERELVLRDIKSLDKILLEIKK